MVNSILGSLDDTNEVDRKAPALSKGLGEDTSWDDIFAHSSEVNRKASALSKGLGEDTSWEEIREKILQGN